MGHRPGGGQIGMGLGRAEDGCRQQQQNHDGHDEPIQSDQGMHALNVHHKERKQQPQPDQGVKVVFQRQPSAGSVVAVDRVPDQHAQGGANAGPEAGLGEQTQAAIVGPEPRQRHPAADGEQHDGKQQQSELAKRGHK